ncbi:hypothetical protein JAAARDRAFT_119004 [Jaapia argillacea MUCL 33604]|uniref:Small ribosomal subunit protein mS35 mitochondrial conserved domain-containing protein n=1 Tax=Jaapia argillacea MUCL 33604 TaxID=933084 RepID=A0A067QJ21_9AGAM|nr:hypothetical protein JAAARDRAFT_119004 [Jaapia argillacea MUCL 33604]
MPRTPRGASSAAPSSSRRINVPRGPELDLDDVENAGESDIDDSTTFGHLILRQNRQRLYYMRLIEHEMPKLVAFRKPFVPPNLTATPLTIRSISFSGEKHPATAKRVIVTPVSCLPLTSPQAIHKMKVVAGPRWSPTPPKDSGYTGAEEEGKDGYVKIACEDFEEPAMNLKWASDTLDRLIKECNANNRFSDLPLDTRHIDAKARKARKGDHRYGRPAAKPSLKDFPKEWLPVPAAKVAPAVEAAVALSAEAEASLAHEPTIAAEPASLHEAEVTLPLMVNAEESPVPAASA